jgi:predicted NUDIX family NTP pyrophosphohydrolase
MKISAGLLIYRIREGIPEVFLIHPGGPFWTNKDLGAWSIPKGEVSENEEPLQAAQREFQEETGFVATAPFTPLTPVKQSSHKTVEAWAAEGNFDADQMSSNTFAMEWPPKSGKIGEFPEADRAAWFSFPEARKRILKGQLPLLNELENLLKKEAG